MRRANRRRGEIEAMIDGERRILCLTLGALAELETAFAVDNVIALARHISSGRLSADGIMKIIAAGLRGGGNILDDEDVAGMSFDGGVEDALRVSAELLGTAFLAGGPPENPRSPQP